MMREGISDHLIAHLNKKLSNTGLSTSDIIKVSPVYGGSINDSFELSTQKERFFIKINSASEFPKMFEKEEAGLVLLKESTPLTVPNTHLIGEHNGSSFLLMEHIDSAAANSNFWEVFGRGLAQLHKNTKDHFGLNYDNYIGSLNQKNSQKADWISFFSDLWSGNFMVGKNGEPVIMDPAVYFGHREMDLAMMHLFGGFDRKLFDAYHEVYPLAKGWESRIEVCNLYPLLVHVNLFGGSYGNRVKKVLDRILA